MVHVNVLISSVRITKKLYTACSTLCACVPKDQRVRLQFVISDSETANMSGRLLEPYGVLNFDRGRTGTPAAAVRCVLNVKPQILTFNLS